MDLRHRRSARVRTQVDGAKRNQKYAYGNYIAHSPILADLVVLELVPDHTDDNVITHEASSIHDLLGLNAKGSLARDLVAEQVAGSVTVGPGAVEVVQVSVLLLGEL